jgi:hypothetical protein
MKADARGQSPISRLSGRMIRIGYADLRDLPLGGTRIGIIRKLACDSFGSRSRSLPAI